MKFVREFEYDYEQEVMRIYASPMLHSTLCAQLGRYLQAALRLGMFEALADGPRTAAEIAEATGLKPHSVHSLIETIATTDYLRCSEERYGLTPLGRGLLAASRGGLRELFEGTIVLTDWLDGIDDFMRTDAAPTPAQLSPERASTLRRAQWAAARLGAKVLGEALAGGTRLLDWGGAYAPLVSSRLREDASARAVIVDRAELLELHRAHFAEAGVLSRVELRPLAEAASLPAAAFDRVLLPQVLSGVEGELDAVVTACAARLSPGGLLLVADLFASAPVEPSQHLRLATFLLEMLGGGARTSEQLIAAEARAGLVPGAPARFLSGLVTVQTATKEAQR